jgi:hypothetical protein
MPHVAPGRHHPVERIDFFSREIRHEYLLPLWAPDRSASSEIIARSASCSKRGVDRACIHEQTYTAFRSPSAERPTGETGSR